MASSTNKKGGKKAGRNRRSRSHMAYNADRRWEINKERKQARHKKKVAKKALRKARKEKERVQGIDI
jgi:hypothetical protein